MKTDTQAQEIRRIGPDTPDNSMVICPQCTSQFVAIPVDVQTRLRDAEDRVASAWGLLANVSGGDWTKQSPEWQKAAREWERRGDPYAGSRSEIQQ